MKDAVNELEYLRRDWQARMLEASLHDEAVERGWARPDPATERANAVRAAEAATIHARLVELIAMRRRAGDGVLAAWVARHLEACLIELQRSARMTAIDAAPRTICIGEVLEHCGAMLGPAGAPFVVNTCYLPDYEVTWDLGRRG